MEEHFLKDFVSGNAGVSHGPWYNAEGDCIIYQVVDEAVIAHRIDDVLTIYESAVSGKNIGFQIKGVSALVSRFGWDGIQVECKENEKELKSLSLSALLLAAYEGGPKTIGRRKAYAGAFPYVADQSEVQLNPSDLMPA